MYHVEIVLGAALGAAVVMVVIRQMARAAGVWPWAVQR
jgi:hypothetical protein